MGNNDLKGRLALITGASGGIGAAIARDFAALQINLALTYSSSPGKVESLISEIRSSIPEAKDLRISSHKVDVGKVEDLNRLFEEVKRDHDGKVVDLLISNAGYGKRIVDVWEIPLEEFEYTININLKASFILVKGVIEGMRDQKWGRIIFMSSIAAYGGGINGCHYAASKGGLASMMKNLSTKLAPYNVSVNDVSPALIGDTGMVPTADVIPGGEASIPLGRMGEPQEVANVVTMLAKTGYMTGQSLLIAGGLK